MDHENQDLGSGFGSTRFAVRVHGETIAADLCAPSDHPDGRHTVMVHGGPGGQKEGPANLFVKLSNDLVRTGISSVRFDFVGVGESSGRYRDMTVRRQAAELAAVIDAARERTNPRSIAVVAESYGATSALMQLPDTDWSALILLWPCIYLLDNSFAPDATSEKMRIARRDGFIIEEGEEVGLRFLQEVHEIECVDDYLRGCRVPTLFIHGDNDIEVPVTQSLRAAALPAGPRKVVIVPGGDHCLELPEQRTLVHREVAYWLHDYL